MLPDKLVMAGIFVLIFVTDYNILAPLDKKKSKKFWVHKKLRSKKKFGLKNFAQKRF